jgi:5-methylcytosine-specific restriction endonuclease McrA
MKTTRCRIEVITSCFSVKRAAWERDGDQCTFVAVSGQRCSARTGLELDHIVEVARGGEASVDNLRVPCRAHNQLTAEWSFGAEFVHAKREAARPAAASGGG